MPIIAEMLASPSSTEVNFGDRVAQLILEMITMVPAVKVGGLIETLLGKGRFGITFVNKEEDK